MWLADCQILRVLIFSLSESDRSDDVRSHQLARTLLLLYPHRERESKMQKAMSSSSSNTTAIMAEVEKSAGGRTS